MAKNSTLMEINGGPTIFCYGQLVSLTQCSKASKGVEFGHFPLYSARSAALEHCAVAVLPGARPAVEHRLGWPDIRNAWAELSMERKTVGRQRAADSACASAAGCFGINACIGAGVRADRLAARKPAQSSRYCSARSSRRTASRKRQDGDDDCSPRHRPEERGRGNSPATRTGTGVRDRSRNCPGNCTLTATGAASHAGSEAA